MIAHRQAGRVRLAPGIAVGVLGVAGAYAGTRLSTSIRPGLLLSLFAGLMLVAAAARLRRRRGAPGQHVPAAESPHGSDAAAVPDDYCVSSSRGGVATAILAESRRLRCRHRAGRWPGAVLAGLRLSAGGLKIAAAATGACLAGFSAWAAGSVIVPALVLALGFEMPVAVGTSLLVIAINSAAALTARLGSHVHLAWPLLGVFAVAALAGALAGNRRLPGGRVPAHLRLHHLAHRRGRLLAHA